MISKQLFARLRDRVREFCFARSANVTIIFALATIPIIGAVGAAVDYSHVTSARTAMQAAVDATALMLTKEASNLTQSQINTKATNYFTALYTRKEVTNISVTPTYTPGNATDSTQVVVKASGTVKASFVSLIGVSSTQIGASSTVKWGNVKLRVALVLDNTGSMADNDKITALKTATKNLLNQLKSAALKDGDVYVSIIPFAKDVNLGSTNYKQSWIDWTEWAVNNGTCSKSGNNQSGNNQSGNNQKNTCIATGTCSNSSDTTVSACSSSGTCSLSSYTTQSSCTSAGVCSKSSYTTQTNCTNNAGIWSPGVWAPTTWTPASWIPANHNTWNGCVADRGLSIGPSPGNYDTNVTAPNKNKVDTLFPAEQFSPCPQAVMGLSYNWSAMTTLVDSMSPGGNTNQAIGLAVGWMSLTGGGPFTVPAMDPKYKYNQVIILLTDGLNTQDRWYTDQNSIDARQKMTCDNAKAAKITLYTVQVNTGGDPTSTLLQSCASDSNKYFLLTSANQMISTFQQIGTQLSNLRVAK